MGAVTNPVALSGFALNGLDPVVIRSANPASFATQVNYQPTIANTVAQRTTSWATINTTSTAATLIIPNAGTPLPFLVRLRLTIATPVGGDAGLASVTLAAGNSQVDYGIGNQFATIQLPAKTPAGVVVTYDLEWTWMGTSIGVFGYSPNWTVNSTSAVNYQMQWFQFELWRSD